MAKQNRAKGRKKTSKQQPTGLLPQLIDFIDRLRYDEETRDQARKLIAWTLLFSSILAFLACISYFFTGHADQAIVGIDQEPGANNWLGKIGAFFADLLIYKGFGVFGILLPMYGIFVAIVMLENEFYQVAKRLLGYVLFSVIWGSTFLSFFLILSAGDGMTSNIAHFDWGGGVGFYLNGIFSNYIGRIGTAFLLIFAVLIFIVVKFNAELRASQLYYKGKDLIKKGANLNEIVKQSSRRNTSSAKSSKASSKTTTSPKAKKATNPSSENTDQQKDAPPELPLEINAGDEVAFEIGNQTPKPKPKSSAKKASASPESLDLEIEAPEGDKAILPVEPKEYIQHGEDNVGLVKGDASFEKIVPKADQELDNVEEFLPDELYDPTLELSGWEKYPLELLEDHGAGKGREVNRAELEGNKNKIIETLGNYGIEITKIKATIGPTVTLYEIVPAPGVRISKIRNLEDDIALNLAALGIRIIAPIPGKGTIGIEVPNSNREIVSLRSVFSTEKFLTSGAELPIAVGRTISNEVYIGDLNKMPHLLMAGATGQGKSVGLNCIIASILQKKHPAEVKFVLIDPKKVEMSLYTALRNHYLAIMPGHEDEPIITDVKDAVNVLKSLCVEMDQRYDLLKKARVRNLKEYNKKFTERKLNPRHGHMYMPYIVLVIDELADMMMIAGKEVEMPIARLAQLARAVGIHLVVATQRPSVNVITGIIKANFPARISYRVISKVDSRTILDANGADQLIGRGDLLFSTGSEIIRIQNAFIDTPEVENIVTYIQDQRGFPEPYYLPELPDEDSGGIDDDEDFEKDVLFEEAARLIVRHQIGSASLIQRKMKLGYNRAGRIIDQLERAKIVGPHSGSKARDVLILDEGELERHLGSI